MPQTISELIPQVNIKIIGVLALLTAITFSVLSRKQRPPPGAKKLPRLPGLPWIGRVWDIPPSVTETAWHFAQFFKQYGPMYEWVAMGDLHIWIGKDSIAKDLLVKRGKIYGDRHELPAAVGIRTGSEILPLMGIGDNFWRHRNFIHTIMLESSRKMFYEYPIMENKLTLRRFLDSPNKWSENVITHASRVAARLAWGDSRHATKLITVVPDLLRSISPGPGPLPNLLPFLQFLPELISPYKRAETKRKQKMAEAFYEAQEDVATAVKEGTAEDSWMKIWLEKNINRGKLDQHESAHAVGSNALVAIATIGSPMHSFFLAMAHYPSWLPRLQNEVDSICGDGHLPTLADLPEMPILRAVVKEVIRWRQAVPSGVPHRTVEDDVYEGYFIPKGTLIHANHFAISRDEEMYPDAAEFHPERWLEPSWPTYKEPLTEHPVLRADIAFGYGIRSCPGQDLVIAELYTLIGGLVWAFDIKRPEGLRGYQNPLPWYENNPFAITMAKHFPLDVKPRSETRALFIKAGCPEGLSPLVKERHESRLADIDRWAVYAPADKPFEWGGLTAEIKGLRPPRAYSPGV